MSTQLILSDEDIHRLTDCWSCLQNNNKYHKDNFISRLFSNLLAANPKLKKVFYNDAITAEQSSLFGDLLSFTMVYLDDLYTLNECMNAFLRENPSLVEAGSQYLEPMGSALILTFRQWLGKGKFDDSLQSSWVKVYVYIANCLLQFAEESKETRSIEEKPIEALRPRRRPVSEIPQVVEQQAKPMPAVQQEVEQEKQIPQPSVMGASKPAATIQFELSSNEKYRGFRRSVQLSSPNPEPISVKIPSTPTFQQIAPPLSPPSAPFDPRRMRNLSRSSTSLNSEEESNGEDSSFDPRKLNKRSSSVDLNEEIPERSARRRSNLIEQSPVPVQQPQQPEPQQFAQVDPRKMDFTKPSKIIADNSDDEFEEKERGFGFDPRSLSKRKSLSPVISDEDSEIEPTTPLFSNRLADDALVNDVDDDDYNFNMKQEESTPNATYTRPSAFDHNSFGIKGLAPIVESDYDETTSSKYESDAEIDQDNVSSNYCGRSSTDGDEISSGVSTLSLHNSDYRSSINSGSDATSVSPSPVLNKFQMGHTAKQASTSSDISYMKPLSSKSTQESPAISHQPSYASLSSSRNHSQQQFKQRASLGFMRSSFVLKKEIQEQGFNEPENVLAKPPTIPAALSASMNSSGKTSTASLQSTLSSNADGCLDLLNSFAPVKNVPNGRQYENIMASSMKAEPKHYRSTSDLQSTNSSVSSKKSLRKRLSSIFSSSSSTKPSLACELTTDLASICTVESNRSAISGFSFFSKRRSLVDTRYTPPSQRKGKKYNVKSVPYDVFA